MSAPNKFDCPVCRRTFDSEIAMKQHRYAKHVEPNPSAAPKTAYEPDLAPNWKSKCDVCGATPIVPLTGMCGPCTFGESDTINGNW